jgi:hypothetical protein
MDFLNQTVPVLISFLLGLITYLVKAVLDLSHRVLRLEVRIDVLLKEIEELKERIWNSISCDKENT